MSGTQAKIFIPEVLTALDSQMPQRVWWEAAYGFAAVSADRNVGLNHTALNIGEVGGTECAALLSVFQTRTSSLPVTHHSLGF